MCKASEVVFDLFRRNNSSLEIETLTGKVHRYSLSADGTYIKSKSALGTQRLGLECFDIVVDLLANNGGKAHKGGGRGKENKVGQGKCTEDTVCGYIATKYYGHNYGDSTFDPVFAVGAIMEHAGLIKNQRGWFEVV